MQNRCFMPSQTALTLLVSCFLLGRNLNIDWIFLIYGCRLSKPNTRSSFETLCIQTASCLLYRGWIDSIKPKSFDFFIWRSSSSVVRPCFDPTCLEVSLLPLSRWSVTQTLMNRRSRAAFKPAPSELWFREERSQAPSLYRSTGKTVYLYFPLTFIRLLFKLALIYYQLAITQAETENKNGKVHFRKLPGEFWV